MANLIRRLSDLERTVRPGPVDALALWLAAVESGDFAAWQQYESGLPDIARWRQVASRNAEQFEQALELEP